MIKPAGAAELPSSPRHAAARRPAAAEVRKARALFRERSAGGRFLSSARLCRLLMDARSNELFEPAEDTVCQSMSAPLSHYYINTSHNT